MQGASIQGRSCRDGRAGGRACLQKLALPGGGVQGAVGPEDPVAHKLRQRHGAEEPGGGRIVPGMSVGVRSCSSLQQVLQQSSQSSFSAASDPTLAPTPA